MEEKKVLIDPFGNDNEETLKEKKDIWNEIFLLCPIFSDLVIDEYKKNGIKGMDDLALMIKTKEKENNDQEESN